MAVGTRRDNDFGESARTVAGKPALSPKLQGMDGGRSARRPGLGGPGRGLLCAGPEQDAADAAAVQARLSARAAAHARQRATDARQAAGDADARVRGGLRRGLDGSRLQRDTRLAARARRRAAAAAAAAEEAEVRARVDGRAADRARRRAARAERAADRAAQRAQLPR